MLLNLGCHCQALHAASPRALEDEATTALCTLVGAAAPAAQDRALPGSRLDSSDMSM